MLTPYDRKQQARERVILAARVEASSIENTPADAVVHTVDWDAAFAAVVAPSADPDGPSPSDLHKPDHGGYPS